MARVAYTSADQLPALTPETADAALAESIHHWDVTLAEHALAYGANPNLVVAGFGSFVPANHPSAQGPRWSVLQAVLSRAPESGKQQTAAGALIDALVGAGAEVNAPGPSKESLLQRVLQTRSIELLNRLIHHGLDVVNAQPPAMHLIEVLPDDSRATVEALAQRLKQVGAPVDAPYPGTLAGPKASFPQATPLEWALYRRDTALADIFLDLGAQAAQTPEGRYPLAALVASERLLPASGSKVYHLLRRLLPPLQALWEADPEGQGAVVAVLQSAQSLYRERVTAWMSKAQPPKAHDMEDWTRLLALLDPMTDAMAVRASMLAVAPEAPTRGPRARM